MRRSQTRSVTHRQSTVAAAAPCGWTKDGKGVAEKADIILTRRGKQRGVVGGGESRPISRPISGLHRQFARIHTVSSTTDICTSRLSKRACVSISLL